MAIRGGAYVHPSREEPPVSFPTEPPRPLELRPSAGGDRFAHHRFEARAAERPDARAVSDRAGDVTYAELDRLAEALAARLRAAGVGPDVRVAVLMEGGRELAVALLAVGKAGGAYVPLDPEYPAERIHYVVEDSAAALLLTHAAAAHRLPDSPVPVVRVDLEPGDARVDAPPARVPADALAYVIYTSGSTGRPKGVGVPHRALAAHNGAAVEHYGLTAADRVAQISSIGFDISVEEIFPTWAAGGTVVFRPAEVPSVGPSFLRWVEDEGVTVLNVPTALWHAWVDDLAASGAALPPSLRLVIVGGEKARPAALERWRKMTGGRVRWINSYGPTEATVTATSHEASAETLGEADGEAEGDVPIGLPFGETRAYVLGPDLLPVAEGGEGELCLGGPGLARGYLGRPALTAGAFVPDPFSDVPGARMYRTGDRVRWAEPRCEGAEGRRGEGADSIESERTRAPAHPRTPALQFLGRLDDQVKVGGFRVEPGEVEAVLAGHPDVAHAAVVARDDGTGRVRLVGYVVPRAGAAAGEGALRRWLRARLPGYMVPSAVVVLDALPLSAHGKVDRRALPAPAVLLPLDAEYRAPATSTEAAVAEIWSEVLGAERVGAGDDFFDLGGHSLLGMQVLSRVRQRFGVELPVRAVFEAPTPAALAARIDTAGGAPTLHAQPPLRPMRREGPLPLSFAQQRLWFLHQMEPESPFYNIPAAVRLTGALDVDALRRALREIVRRHEALRTTFLAGAEGSVQVVHPAPDDFPLPVADTSARDRAEADAEAWSLAVAEARAPFDLGRDLMLRALLVRVAGDEHLLVLNLHHVAGDGWSIGLLFHEVAELYGAFRAGRPSPLDEPPVQYADYAVWQREWLSGEALEGQLDYWRHRLAGAPPLLELPTDRPRPAVQSHRGGTLNFRFPLEAAARVRELARREGASLFMVLLAGLDVVLHRWSGADDVVVGSPTAGRVRREVEGLIGFFVNTLALRVDLSGEPSFRELLARARETALDAYAHQDLPFERLVEELAPERTLDRMPLFQVLLVLQNAPEPPVELPELEMGLEELASGTAKFDLLVELRETADGGLEGMAEYAADLFDHATVARMMDQLGRALDAAAREPSARIADLPLLGVEDRAALLETSSGAKADYPDVALHSLFEAQAARTPGAVALVFGEETLTYAELDAKANRIAHLLRARGVGAESPVAVFMERSVEMVAALYGVLKAGAAYVPVDPEYPEGRVAYMLEDSASALALTLDRLASRLPEGIEAVALDRPGALEGFSADRPASPDVGTDRMAYVIYTSGSTGRPKGAMNAHRGVVNRILWMQDAFGLTADDAVLQKTPFSFDVSVWEFFWPLAVGARLVIAPPAAHRDPAALSELIERHGVTTLHFVPSMLRAWIEDADAERCRRLSRVMSSGEALPPALAARFFERLPTVGLHNLYGPTEAAVDVTHFACSAEDGRATVPIGAPIANTRMYVLDGRGGPCPVGVPGELFIAGAQVGRGYWRRPELTADRFLPDPFSDVPGARMYRTGDRARWVEFESADSSESGRTRAPSHPRTSVVLEYLGRTDFQVKVRGFRIEPGEVEGALERHPGVAGAVVHLREDTPGDPRLVAYVVPVRRGESPVPSVDAADSVGEDSGDAGRAGAQLSQWEALFDDMYSGAPAEEETDASFDIVGWNSSYTGQPIPAEQMREWVDRTAERIGALGPGRVLELGVGTGLLLFRVAPAAAEYVGTDFSAQVIEKLGRRVASAGDGLPPVRLMAREAADFGGIPPRRFDTAVLNSVCQYFPGAEYLARVVEGTVEALEDGGAFFIGDVRDLSTLKAFRAAVELDSAPADLPAREVRDRAWRAVEEEEELVMDPGFFRALQPRVPRIGRVEVRVKRGVFHNELTRHRYDVVLRVGSTAPASPAPSRDWDGEGLSVDRLREILAGEGGPVAVMGIPNARLGREMRAMELLAAEDAPATAGEMRRALDAEDVRGVDPEALWEIADALNLEVEIRPAGSAAPGRMDALFHAPGRTDAAFPDAPMGDVEPAGLANDPLWAAEARELAPVLRAWLKEQLPEHMVPAAVVPMEAFPLTPSGKVDRRALPAPEPVRRARESELVEPRTETEERLAVIWAGVLRLERVYANDNFFDLGGHSLLATQLAVRVREAFGMEMPLQRVFEAPTVAEMARVVEAAKAQALLAVLDEMEALPEEELAALLENGSASPAEAPTGGAHGHATEAHRRLAALSPEWRRLLELRLKMARSRAAGPELRPRARPDGTAPLSFAQQRLWVVERMQPGGSAYNMPHPMGLSGRLDVAALGRALDALVARHESLRTTFEERGGIPVQVVHPAASLDLAVDDLSHLAPEAREAEARRRIDADADTGFDLAKGPLFRASLLRLAADEHVLLLCMHHIVSDGWSIGVLHRELGTLYAAFRAGLPDPLPAPALQYADFAAWQREHLTGDTLRGHLDFWRGALEGAPPALELPTDRPRPAVESRRGRVVRVDLPAWLAESLGELARETGGTLFAVLLAGLRVVLARHAGQDDVVVGTPVANRTRSEVEGLIGVFVNTLALRASVPGDPTFRELAREEARAALGAFNHQDLPFERLVEELKVSRDPGRNPVFQVMLTLQNARMDPPELPGCVVTLLKPEYETAKFDLTFDVYTEDGGGLRVDVEYATDLFDASTAERLAAHFAGVLRSAAAAPERRRSQLEMADAGERALLARLADGAPASALCDTPVHRLFERQAERTPNDVAVEFGDERLTYARLNARANRLARRLREAGVGVDARVGVAVERSAELVVALLAALKAGGAYVPLDAAYPADRLAYMLENGAVSALVVRGEVPAALASYAGPVISVDDIDDDRDAGDGDDGDLDVETSAEGLAYVLYTSGSTGMPKGVGVPHRAVVRLVRETDFADFGPEETFLQLAPVAFDLSTLEVWAPLLNGGRLVVAPPHQLTTREIGALIKERGVTTIWLTAGLFHLMVDEELAALGHLRQLLAGGDVLSVPHVRRVVEAHPALRMIDGYGPTENTTFTSCHTVRPGDLERLSIPVGRPIAGTTAWVMDERGRPCPVGVAGELYTGGEGVARGYLGRPGQTAASFVPDPFSHRPGARLYRTGDRARWLEDGTLEFLGRADQQVKVRGFRVEPGEIETALKEIPEVGDAVVIARADGGGDRRLVAYVVARNASAPRAADLRAALASRLPAHMVPSAFVAVDAIPLTTNGKVDRRALPDPDPASDNAYVAPRTPAEEVLAGIWAGVLGVDRVGADDDFFLLGGHSLLATQVVSRVRQALGADLPLRVMFEATTLRRLAARVDEARGGEEVPPVLPVPRDGPLPLSFAQERLWFLERLDPGAGVYNMPARVRMEGEVDAEALRRALETSVSRHEALRSRYSEVEGQPVQAADPPSRFDLPLIDFAGEDEAAAWLSAEAWRPFDLERGPLVRAALLRFSAAEHVLALNIHHSVADGWSLGILLREVSAAYEAFRRGESPDLPPVPLQYADFAAWQRGWLSGDRVEAQLAGWRDALAGAPSLLELPTDRPRPVLRRHLGAAHAMTLAPELKARLQGVARREGATLFMTLLAAWQALLARWSGQDDVVVGAPIAGRNHAESEGIVGFFVNMLPLRMELAGRPTFRELLSQARRRTLDAYARQDLPFERLVEELRVERSLSHTPVFQAAFALQNFGDADLRIPGIQARWMELDPRVAKYDLTLELEETEAGIVGALEYDADLFDASTAARLADHFTALLEAVAADVETRPLEADLRTAAERERLDAWSRSDVEVAAETDALHAAFEAHAARSPNAAAVLSGDAAITYAELDARSNRLARRLRASGVGAEARVGVAMERSPELLVALLAVLKAGGAYVPLDPSYPEDRLAFMLADSGAAVLVTEEAHADRFAGFAGRTMVIEREAEAIDGESGDTLGVDVGPDDLAYVIYTSGSTGRPKGVLVRHGSIVNLLAVSRAAFGVHAGDVMPSLASSAFDISLFELLLPLSSGAAVRVVPRERVMDARALLGEIADATLLHAVPALMREIARVEREAPRLARLRGTFVGGDQVPADLLAEMAAAFPAARTHILYGPTEGTILASAHPVPAGGAVAGHPIGRPLGNVRLYVCDEMGGAQPLGVPGELLIGGMGVARGYHGRPDLTAERFVPDPFSTIPGARLYRTGDRARWKESAADPARADRTHAPSHPRTAVLEFLGRIDQQVKVRGFRIEPGEVEAALEAIEGVSAAVVAPRPGPGGTPRLVAWVVAEEGAEMEIAGLAPALARVLPEYMVPAAFVRLDALPLTPNGKIDRKSLPDPEPEADAAYEAPRTPTEESLAAAFEELLDAERVGREGHFFALGGHSLLAARLASRVRTLLEVELPLREVFEAPSVRALAERVDALRAAADGATSPEIVPLREGEEAPLSFAQERMWFLHQLDPASGAYNIPFAFDVAGEIDVEALRVAIEETVARHAALRSTFAEREGGPALVVRAPGRFDLPVVPVGDEAELERRVDEEGVRPFDLEHGPLVRATLFRVGTARHVLALNLHHIAADGWSFGILLRELSERYAARVEGRDPHLPEPGVSYADYAAWQRRWFAAGGVLERQAAYWRRKLAGAPAVLEMPADRPRPARPTLRGGLHPFRVPAAALARLRGLAADEHATLFMAALAAFQALLGRWARTEDVVVGTPIAGRTRAEAEDVVGLFVNTLALRADLSGAPTFRALLKRVRETTLEAYAHQELPFERLVDELKVERSLAIPPVFQVMFALQNAPAGDLELAGARVSTRETGHHTAKFDLSLSLDETADGLAGWMEYAADLFDAGTAERLSTQFARLLEAVAADPDQHIGEIDLLGDEGRREIAAWNDAVADPRHLAEPPVHVGVAMQARRTPDAVAVAWEGGTLPFAELDARANRLARHLVSLGVRPDSRVVVCLERGPEMVVALLGVLKAGAAYVPVVPDYPAERKAFLLRDSAAPVVLTQSHLLADLPSSDAAVVALDTAWGEMEMHPATDPGIAVDPESLAYVIYTSGSTGQPKGVEIPHRALTNHMAWMSRAFPLGEGGSVLQKTPFGFDASVWEFWAPLLEGARLVMARPGGHGDPAYLVETIAREGITTIQLVPLLLRALLDEPGLERCASLRRVYVGGEALAAELVERLKARLDVEVVNLYGPTETCIQSVIHVAEPPFDAPGVPIGRPVANDRAYVLDEALRPVPAGVVGELCIGGAGLARGYLRRPGLTAEKFVPDPVSGVPGARLYRTGDLARLGADGEVRYVGRADFQVKVRGHRVEPGEVEAALLTHPSVREAVVIAADDRLAAYVVPAEGAAPSPAGLRDHLRAVLPDPLVPTAWVVLDRLPLTPHGKVDRAALPAPEAAADPSAHAAPRTPTEEVLAGLWATLLGVERVGVNDDFFALGGHSLLATQVMSRLRQALRVDLPLRELFDAPTVARLAERVDAARASAEGMDDVPLVRGDADADLPLSFAQERLWFVERLQPGRAIYSMPMSIRLTGDLHPEALRIALEGIVHRHEPLRTTFTLRGGRPVQVIAPPSQFDLPLFDLAHLPREEAEGEAARLAGDDALAAFDLERGPLFRATLVRRTAEEWTLLLNMHHAVGDAWSTEVLLRELAALYGAALAGTEAALPPLPVRYADYAAWQRAWLSGVRLQRQLAFWRRTLTGAPVLELPADRPRAAVQSFRGGWHSFRLPEPVAEGVDRLARAEGATRFMTLLAAFKALLLRYTGTDDVVVGSPIAGRTRAETEGLIGLFVNTLALRTDLAGDPSYRELLRRVRETTLDAYAHQDLPFEKLVEEMKVERSLGRHPLFQVSFSVQGMEADPAALPGVRMEMDEGDTGTTKFDLTFVLWPSDGGLAGGIEYAADLFDAATVERMARHFEALLEAALADPDRPLSRLPALLRGDERRRVLAEWSRAEHPFPALPVHALFEARADEAPHHPAISFGGAEISYAELDGRANRLAHHLIARGVGPETRVGLFAGRSPEAAVAILAILKAGGAWLPLDPSNPAARLAWMASDSGVSILLATADVPAELSAVVDGAIDLRAEAEAIAARPAERPGVEIDPDHLAYVIYTSGSTGTPKGVLVTHRGVPNLALAQGRRFAVDRASRVLQFASLSFDASVSELFATLLAGATLVVAPREALVPGPALLETMRRERISHVTLPPSVLAVLSPDDLPELRALVSAGEAVSAPVVERWAPGRRFVNAYGPTEATVGTAAAVCEPDGRPPAIGRPFDNVRVYVLDAGGDPVPVGVPGELHAGGPGVARGYHGRAGLTAERFVPDALSGEPGARLYRTGDRVRWRADGELEFLGRTDEQVKLRGFRIEPGEVAAVLCALHGVRDALALVREHAGDRRLVAWIVAEPGTDQPDPLELRAELKRRLPEYMVPSAVVMMEDFPRTPNGKVDRAALPLPEVEAGEAFVAPRGEMEGRIAGVWSEVLGRGAVGVNDNFFEIGGHSLLLVRLHERLRAALEIDVTLVDLFQFPTVAALSARIEQQAKAARGEPAQETAGAGRDRGSARRQALIRKR